MATLNICGRHAGKVDRFQVSLASLEDSVQSLASEISKQIKTDDFDIIYCGQVLKQDNSLSYYSLQNQSTLYVVDKFKSLDNSASGTSANRNDVTMAVQSALLNSEYRTIVERMLCDPDTVENIIASTPGLDRDPCVLAMLQEPELLAVLAHPTNMDSLLRQHPSFAQAAVSIATAVNEEGAKLGQKGGASAISYSLDQMSDEDDDEVPQPSRSRGNISGITASQLAAALEAATGSASGPQPPSVAIMPTSQNAPGPSTSGTITGDFFQQAMVHAQTASNDAALQQLRDMGITDENVARQALLATGGDIQAAIDLIFGDGFL